MHLYTFYLSAALLTFGIGSFVVCFYIYPTLKVNTLTNEDVSNRAANYETQVKVHLKAEHYLSEKDKSLLLFNTTINKWLNNQKPEETVDPSTEVIEGIYNSKLDIVYERVLLQSAQKSYKPLLIDVNGDGEDELAVLSNYSPPEFCELRIFRKTKNDFEVILSTYTEVENFKLRESQSKRYFDLETTHSYPGSETSLAMAIYKFDGEKYIKKECYDYIYLYKDENDKLQKLNEPKLVSLHCC